MMPGIVQGGARSGNATGMASFALSGAAGSLSASRTIWSRQRDDVCFEQLKKFWGELPIQARRELLRIDKLTLCEQARKNLNCSRCHGLLLECFSRIVMYRKSLQQEHAGGCCSPKATACKVHVGDESGNQPDPSIHPWGGLDTTKDGILTLLDRFICARSLDVLQKVFDSARQREHDRELLYPNACGGGGRGWTGQGLTNSGRGHVTRESCALHTSRLSCDTLLDFWSALGDETRLSLLRMKEEDFIERLMYRFDSKRFCRDCRRNVLREFKELKELKRMRKELHCTSWFCVADTDFQCEVTQDSIQADWQHSFTDIVSTYHHFEWAVGTGEGKNDILDFEDVGLSVKVQSNALYLSSSSACFITLRAWKLDGRCIELCVKAHVLKGQSCVHRRLLIGDGFVTITKGDGIRSFLEHAEEAEEDEDDDSNDKDGSGLDGDGSRQKHAKSPELAREFLLDAATVIFKEQVEKAFREGTAWQNAHSLFVSLAIKLLEERVHVACKGIITLEKQIKLLEEEENEKREEQERKERRKNREREKKLRRKERLKQKEMERERKHIALSLDLSASLNKLHTSNSDESLPSTHSSEDSVIDLRDSNNLADPICTNTIDDNSPNQCTENVTLRSGNLHKQRYIEGELHFRGRTRSSNLEQSKSSRLNLSLKAEALCNQDSKWYDEHRSAFGNETNFQHDAYGMKLKALSRCFRGGPRAMRERAAKRESINCTLRVSEKFNTSYGRNHDSYDSQSCRCNQPGEYRMKDGYSISTITGGRDNKSTIRADSKRDVPRKLYRCNKQNRGCYIADKYPIPKGRLVTVASRRDAAIHTRQVWEPMGVQKKYSISNSETDVPLRTAAIFCTSEDIRFDKDEKSHQRHDHEPSVKGGPSVLMSTSKIDSPNDWDSHEDNSNYSNKFDESAVSSSQIGFLPSEKSLCCSNYISEERSSFSVMPTLSVSHSCHAVRNSSSSDNISFLSEVDSSTCSSSTPTTESTSDSEDSSQQLVGRDISVFKEDVFHKHQDDVLDKKFMKSTVASSKVDTSGCPSASYTRNNLPRESTNIGDNSNGGSFAFHAISPKRCSLPVHSHINMPIFPSTTMVYQNQNANSWSAAPTKGFLPYSQNQYQFHPHWGYGLPANRYPAVGMQCDIIHPPVTSSMFNEHHHHHLHNGTKRIFSTCPKEQLKNANTCRVEQANKATELMQNSSQNKLLPLEFPSSEKHWTKMITPITQECSQSFSLFHFGGPLVGAVTSGKEHTNSISVSPESPENIEEYSLFATGNGSSFSFSSLTL